MIKSLTLAFAVLALCSAVAVEAAPPDKGKPAIHDAGVQVSTCADAGDCVRVTFDASIPHVAAIECAGEACTIGACGIVPVHLAPTLTAKRKGFARNATGRFTGADC